MDRDNSYFYLSGFISFLLFGLFLSTAIYMMVVADKVKQFALKKDNYISVSIAMPKIQTKSEKKSITKPAPKPIDTPKKQKEVDIDNLFSDVWTKSIKPKKVLKEKKLDKRVLQTLTKKIKKSETKNVESISQKIKTIQTKKISDKNVKTSTSTEVNEYFAKIQAIVYDHFYPPQNSQGHTVKAVITLGALGKVLDFRILTYSTSTALNEECKKIKERLKNVVFPVNPDGKSGNYTVMLTSKE